MKRRWEEFFRFGWGLSLVVFVAAFGYFQLWTKRPLISSIEPDGLTGEYDMGANEGIWNDQKVFSPAVSTTRLATVLGRGTEPKRIEVDLTNQRLYAYEGGQKIYEFVISTGRWGRTPPGDYKIWGKSRYQKMSGGSGSTYYYLPNVPFIMWIDGPSLAASRGFSLHGTYWHNNFGYPMSHGCINMRTEDAGTLFYWSDPEVDEDTKMLRADASNRGTPVVVYGVTPDD